jgi:putative ABC transport system permease protein
MAQLFLIALRNLAQHTKRTLLIGGAISGVTALLVILACLSSGAHATMFESATTLMTGHINVAGFYKYTAGQSAPLVTDYDEVLQVVRDTLPDIDYVAPRIRGWARLVSDTGSIQSGIGGIDIAGEPGIKRVLHLVEGNLDDLTKPHTVLLFEQQAKKLDVHTGDSIVVATQTSRGVNNTQDLRVIGIAQDIGMLSAFNVFMPADSLRELYQLKSSNTSALLVYVRDLAQIPADMERLQKALEAKGYGLLDREAKPFWEKIQAINREEWTGQKLDMTSWEEETAVFQWSIKAMDGLTAILTVVLLIIIAIGIMNSMWIAIRERTREIGTLRAIGMQRLRIGVMFVIEAFTLAALGTTLGALLGLVVVGVLNGAHIGIPPGARMFMMASTLQLSVELSQILRSMIVITACTTLVSVIPSTRAARLKPITAMQHIG